MILNNQFGLSGQKIENVCIISPLADTLLASVKQQLIEVNKGKRRRKIHRGAYRLLDYIQGREYMTFQINGINNH